jgi:hypothetical protein
MDITKFPLSVVVVFRYKKRLFLPNLITVCRKVNKMQSEGIHGFNKSTSATAFYLRGRRRKKIATCINVASCIQVLKWRGFVHYRHYIYIDKSTFDKYSSSAMVASRCANNAAGMSFFFSAFVITSTSPVNTFHFCM